jgi:diaminohydroxyphosphoribosylaminopyrimidine deaminase/5-amino-6-(5-phosphoribosylamino)uracil reductase
VNIAAQDPRFPLRATVHEGFFMAEIEAQRSPRATPADHQHLREALGLAARIPRRPWPNPPVGCVVVREGEVVGRGAHLGAGEPHAERVALAEAGARARGATLYCTLEPCVHHGRTPPCTEAILAAGVRRVVAGVADRLPPAAGGADRLRREGLEVLVGVEAEACLEMIWPFVCSDGFARPYVELKTALSLDGRFGAAADPAGHPTYLTGDIARRDVHRRRRWVDLVLVGHGTARHDRPRLDARLAAHPDDGPREEPWAGCVVASAAADTPLARARWLVFHPEGKKADLAPGAEGVSCPTTAAGLVDPAAVLAACRDRGLHAVMVEGGPRLAAAFLAAGLVDRWVQYHAPRVLGAGPRWPEVFAAAPDFTLTGCARLGGDLRAVWDRRDFHAALRGAVDPGEDA